LKALLHTTVSGKGKPLILLHGLFGMGDNLSMIAKPLSDHFQVYQLDLRNHGRSPHMSSMTFTEMADDVLAVMDHYQLSEVCLLGHSLGGKVAMQVALQQAKRVRKLIVADIAPVAYRGNHDEVFAGLNAVELSGLSSRRDADLQLKKHIDESGVRLFILKSLYRNDSGQFDWRLNVRGLEACYEDLRQALTAEVPFSGPTLFIKGEHSSYIQAEHRAAIEHLFSDAQLKIIQNTGHWLHAEKPEVFNSLVMRFLLPD
jgi:esterase